MRKKNIFFLSNVISSYQFDFLSELNNKVFLKCLFLEKKLKNFKWALKKKKWYSFNNKPLFPKIFSNNRYFDIIIVGGYNIQFSLISLIYSKIYKIKYYFWLEKTKKSGPVSLAIKKIYFFIILRFADGVMAIGKEAAKFYKNYNSNIIYLPYSINISKFKKKKYRVEKKITFLFVGQLIDRKGIIELLNAFNDLPTNYCVLKIAGIGPHKKTIENLSFKNKSIKYLGFLNKEKLIYNLNTSDIFILPSKYDGWGVVITEAMASGLPVIGTKYTSAFNDLIIDGYNGKRCDPYSVKSIKKSMLYYINNKSKITSHGKKNRNIVLNSLCNSQRAANYLISKIK